MSAWVPKLFWAAAFPAEGRVSARDLGAGGATGLNGTVRAVIGVVASLPRKFALPPAARLPPALTPPRRWCAPAFGTTDGMLVESPNAPAALVLAPGAAPSSCRKLTAAVLPCQRSERWRRCCPAGWPGRPVVALVTAVPPAALRAATAEVRPLRRRSRRSDSQAHAASGLDKPALAVLLKLAFSCAARPALVRAARGRAAVDGAAFSGIRTDVAHEASAVGDVRAACCPSPRPPR